MRRLKESDVVEFVDPNKENIKKYIHLYHEWVIDGNLQKKISFGEFAAKDTPVPISEQNTIDDFSLQRSPNVKALKSVSNSSPSPSWHATARSNIEMDAITVDAPRTDIRTDVRTDFSDEDDAIETLNFNNWGKTVKYMAADQRIVTNSQEIIAVVKEAMKNNKTIRVSGYRHSWSDIFGEDGCYMISMIDKWKPPIIKQAERNVNRETHSIEILSQEGDTALIRFGAGLTNEMLRVWCSANKYSLPMNVIMVEISLGGSNQPVCHGAGLTNPSLSDLVEKIYLVNSTGRQISISKGDPRFSSAVGGFGLFGVVTKLELRLMKGNYLARFDFKKVPYADAIPRKVNNSFKTDAHKFYCEWFWFPGSDEAWINCWDRFKGSDKQYSDVGDYPTDIQADWQALMQTFSNVLNHLPRKFIMKAFGKAAMLALPDGSKNKTARVCDALHFRRGIHNLHCYDMEANIEIPLSDDGKTPNLQFVSDLWWIAIDLINEKKKEKKYPVQIALEMRLTKGSQVLLAPMYGYHYNCSIEVLSLENRNEFVEFCQELIDLWYIKTQAEKVRFRLHSCKMINFKVDGLDYIDFLRREIPDLLKQFRSQVSDNDFELFKNPLLEKLLSS